MSVTLEQNCLANIATGNAVPSKKGISFVCALKHPNFSHLDAMSHQLLRWQAAVEC